MGVASPDGIFDGGAGGGVPFATVEQKKRWAKDLVKLGIVRAQVGVVTQYGEKVRYTVVEQGSSERYLFDMGTSDVRVDQAQAVNDKLIDPQVSVVAPVYLVQIPTDKGNPAWAFSTQPGDGSVTEIKGDEPAAAAPVTQALPADDDIPF